MKFPYLKAWNNADCVVTIHDAEPSKNGNFPIKFTYEGRCNLSEKSRTVRSADGAYVRLACTIHIEGDIALGLDRFSGKATVNGGRPMLIETVDRPRNPDGTVHHTRLGLV